MPRRGVKTGDPRAGAPAEYIRRHHRYGQRAQDHDDRDNQGFDTANHIQIYCISRFSLDEEDVECQYECN